MPMNLRPIVTLTLSRHAEPWLFFMADGSSFQVVDLGDDDCELGPEEEIALIDAIDWGRDPSQAPPPGWRYASLREFFPVGRGTPCGCVDQAH